MEKIVRIGKTEVYKDCFRDVFCKIKFDNGKLSISGVEGPYKNGNAAGSCGQIIMSIKENKEGYIKEYAPLWNEEKFYKFIKIWDEWHLNDMRAGCEHQRKYKWEDKRINPDELPKNLIANRDNKGVLAIWVREKEHKDGLLCKKCNICGYEYGSSWLFEKVPDDVIEFLFNLPDTDIQPCWI